MNFDQAVLSRSHEIPVVVDFWAPWCGPCQQLGPSLEKLAKENSHLWELIKINVDENPEVSGQYGIRSIPAVKMFYQGQVIAEFTGALPIPAIESWLSENLPSEAKSEFERLKQQEGDIPDQHFIDAMKSLSTSYPDFKDARVEMARHLVFLSPADAVQAIEDIRMGEELFDAAEKIKQLAFFMEHQLDEDIPVAKALAKSQQAIKKGNLEEAIKQIIEANQLDKNYEKDLPRLTAIALFEILGSKNGLTKKYRRIFDMVLY